MKILHFIPAAILLTLLASQAETQGQDLIRNATEFTDQEYKTFKKTLIDRHAWEQLQKDFEEWKTQYPLRHTDLPAIHLIEGEPIVSLYVSEETLSEVEENRKAGITRFCKLIFKNKRYDEVHVTFMDKDDASMTHSITISKKAFHQLYEKERKTDKLLPSKQESIKERARMFDALNR